MNSENSWELIGKFLTCASKGDRIGLNKMLMEGVSPNLKDYDDRTALHLAASEGHASIVELLLEHNACVNPYDRWKRTPLADARHYKRKDICKILEAYGGECDTDSYQHEPNSIEYEIDHAEIECAQKDHIYQNSDFIVEKVKWRGTWVVQTTVNIEHVVDYHAQDIFEELRKLRHPNLVQFLGAVIQNQNIIILTENLCKGSLYNMLKKNPLDLQTALQFSLDIARGMNYLHEHKPKPIVHKYLSARNLFPNGARHLKIGDFWWQRLKNASPTLADFKDERKKNCYYMTPKGTLNELYDTKVDVLSFAHILYEMLEGLPSNSTGEICQGEFKFKRSKCHQELRKLICDCHNSDSTKRPTFCEIIKCLEEIDKLHPKFDCLLC